VPIISAKISWLIFGTTVSGLLSLPNCESNYDACLSVAREHFKR
jgi:hypothetical protein